MEALRTCCEGWGVAGFGTMMWAWVLFQRQRTAICPTCAATAGADGTVEPSSQMRWYNESGSDLSNQATSRQRFVT